jgi:hypothetical protein
MNHRNHIRLLGGINKALAAGSAVAAIVHAQDVETGCRMAFGRHGKKRPHRGIACPVPGGVPHLVRHIRGPRDERSRAVLSREDRAWQEETGKSAIRDPQPVTVFFTE